MPQNKTKHNKQKNVDGDRNYIENAKSKNHYTTFYKCLKFKK